MMRFIIAAPDDATLSRRNPQFRISISGSAFDDLRYQRISEAACDIRHLSLLRFCEGHTRPNPLLNCPANKFHSPLRNAVTKKAIPLGDAVYRSPTTGIASCCPRATSGHAAAAPPSSVKKALSATGGQPGAFALLYHLPEVVQRAQSVRPWLVCVRLRPRLAGK